jgi:hypothetical protein
VLNAVETAETLIHSARGQGERETLECNSKHYVMKKVLPEHPSTSYASDRCNRKAYQWPIHPPAHGSTASGQVKAVHSIFGARS